ncbi:MAG: RagB/SusD family nutrient uptake outer membrane protein [Bacteroidales bacterium]|jgi:hypothetical protein|nr:RagB/SusD family nutrient uptake outer membrane protein [Bacteroidales bacterium]
MKKYVITLNRRIFSCLLVLGILQSCDSFENEPLERIQDEDVWASIDSTGTHLMNYLNGIYAYLPTLHNRLGNDYLDSGSDDAVPSVDKNDSPNVNSFRNGRLSARNAVEDNAWSRNYEGIRQANVFLANVDRAHLDVSKTNMVKTWKAEARFLRAYYYFDLIRRWSGVPLIGDKVFSITDNLSLPRNTPDQCADYILSELNAIEKDLYNSSGLADANIGRATNGAAVALRVRLLLFMASPLNNPAGDASKWQKAAEEARKLIDLNVYSLHSDFKALFYTLKNTETIFLRESATSNTVELNNSPVGYQSASYSCKGYTSPSQSLVDAFLTISGKNINEPNSGYDAQNPYANRDPRLGLTVFYNGSNWLNRRVETFEGGMDKPNTPYPQTKTGYYLRKFMGANESSASLANTHHSFIMFRYAEILLSYAEALNEYDPVGSKAAIEDALIQIRKRAGIQADADNRYGLPVTYSQEEMRNIIHNERRIELAFEEHRFYDIRRWRIAENVMNTPVEGMKITKLGDNSFRYERISVQNSVFDAAKMYWFPIPYYEITSNPQLEQNPGWNY